MATILKGRFNGHQLYRLRIKRGLSIIAVAKMVERAGSSIYHWENGSDKPNAQSIFRLANALQVSTEYFFEPEHK